MIPVKRCGGVQELGEFNNSIYTWLGRPRGASPLGASRAEEAADGW